MGKSDVRLANSAANPGHIGWINSPNGGKGSLMETETLVTLAVRLKYLTREAAEGALGFITEISKMLTALRTNSLGRAKHWE
jgi:hypothetical protein